MSHLLDDPLREGMFSPAEEAISFTVGLDQLVSRFHATVHTDVDDGTADATSSCAVTIPPAPS